MNEVFVAPGVMTSLFFVVTVAAIASLALLVGLVCGLLIPLYGTVF